MLNAPSEASDLTLFALHEGTKVRIDDPAGEWADILLADGKVGWLKLDLLEVTRSHLIARASPWTSCSRPEVSQCQASGVRLSPAGGQTGHGRSEQRCNSR